LAAVSLLATSLPATAEPLRVVTTVPDLADIVVEIGGDRVEVQSLSKGMENLHAVVVTPSMLVALSRADLFFEMGLALESTWLPSVLRAARNPAIEPGKPGFVNVSIGWQPIEVPKSTSRQAGDLHPQGNPHFNLDVRAGRHFADRILEALVAVDPSGESSYRAAYDLYSEKLSAAEAKWKEVGRELRGKKVAVYHLEFNYFVRHYGMTQIVSIEPKPGIPPKPRDVARVIQLVRKEEVPVILTAAWSNNRQVKNIARQTGATVVELPNMVHGAPWAKSWIDLMDGLHDRILQAYGAAGE